MAHILMVGGHEETFRMIEDLPVELSVFQNSESVTERQARRAHRLCVFDYRDPKEALRMARALHDCQPLDAVVFFTEYGLMPAAVIKEALGIKGNATEAVRLTRDKIAMREHLANDLGAVDPDAVIRPPRYGTFCSWSAAPLLSSPQKAPATPAFFASRALTRSSSRSPTLRRSIPGRPSLKSASMAPNTAWNPSPRTAGMTSSR